MYGHVADLLTEAPKDIPINHIYCYLDWIFWFYYDEKQSLSWLVDFAKAISVFLTADISLYHTLHICLFKQFICHILAKALKKANKTWQNPKV